MNFKIYPIIFLLILCFDLFYSDVDYISTEVIYRKGGMSNYKKSILLHDGKIGLIYGWTHSKSTLEILEKYAICEGTRTDKVTTYPYFSCPEKEDKFRNFCCGKKGEQKCCTENDFRSSIKFVRNFLYASISTILVVFLSLFNLLLVTSIILYWYCLRNKDKRPKNQYEIPTSAIPLNFTTPVTRSDLTDNTISKLSLLHARNKNTPSILSKPVSNTPTSSVIIVPRAMKKR